MMSIMLQHNELDDAEKEICYIRREHQKNEISSVFSNWRCDVIALTSGPFLSLVRTEKLVSRLSKFCLKFVSYVMVYILYVGSRDTGWRLCLKTLYGQMWDWIQTKSRD